MPPPLLQTARGAQQSQAVPRAQGGLQLEAAIAGRIGPGGPSVRPPHDARGLVHCAPGIHFAKTPIRQSCADPMPPTLHVTPGCPPNLILVYTSYISIPYFGPQAQCRCSGYAFDCAPHFPLSERLARSVFVQSSGCRTYFPDAPIVSVPVPVPHLWVPADLRTGGHAGRLCVWLR